jgi:hypothetical protein
VALISLKLHTTELLRALLERLQRYTVFMHPMPVHSDHKAEVGQMLAAAARIAMVKADDGPEMQAVADAIQNLVVANLHKAQSTDMDWNTMVSVHRRRAEQIWNEKSHEFQEHWAVASSPINKKAIDWQLRQIDPNGQMTGYHEFLDRGKEHFTTTVLETQVEQMPTLERISINVLNSALRAVSNMGTQEAPVVQAVSECLMHRSETIQAQAATTLGKVADKGVAEPLLLQNLERQLDDGGKLHRRTPKVTNATLEALMLSTDGMMSVAGMQRLIRLILQRPLHFLQRHEHHDKQPTEICIDSCVKGCNRFLLNDCTKDCSETCAMDDALLNKMRSAIRRVWHTQPETREQHLEGFKRHAPTAHPSIIQYTSMRHGRNLGFWDKLDLEEFSLTALDLTISHEPVAIYRFFGSKNLLGTNKGAGCAIQVDSINSLTLTLAPFQFFRASVNIDNYAAVSLELFGFTIPIVYIKLEFGFSITATVNTFQQALASEFAETFNKGGNNRARPFLHA